MLIIGAGATRGSTENPARQCLPPLNADFFTQLQRINRSKHQDAIRGVINDAVQLFGPNFDLTMEEYFTQLESIGRTVRLAGNSNPAFSASAIGEKRDRLMRALAAVLEESTDVSKRGTTACTHHASLVSSLRPRDTIVSFNYDCVMDHALRRNGSGKWSAKYGYCFPSPARVDGHANWDADDAPRKAQDSIYLLKLHGSLNWVLPASARAASGRIKLKERLYQQRGTPRFTIIPPEWVKNIERDQNFATLWRYAERAIRHAKTVALVGFSFTPTDLHVESLFRVALANTRSLKTLVVANPSKVDRHRIRSVFAKPLGHGTIVRQYADLGDFTHHLGDSGW